MQRIPKLSLVCDNLGLLDPTTGQEVSPQTGFEMECQTLPLQVTRCYEKSVFFSCVQKHMKERRRWRRFNRVLSRVQPGIH
jgi:hypothetical protein